MFPFLRLLPLLFLLGCTAPVWAQKKGAPEQPLQNTYWQLIWLGATGKYADNPSGDIYVEFAYGTNSLSGFGGCNRFNGTYLLESKRGIKLTGLISTRMYCPESINQEQMLLQALSTASSYKIKGRKLSLYAGTQLVATFEAVTIRERNPVGE